MLGKFHHCENFSEIYNHLLNVLRVFKYSSSNSLKIAFATLSAILPTDHLLTWNWHSKEQKASLFATYCKNKQHCPLGLMLSLMICLGLKGMGTTFLQDNQTAFCLFLKNHWVILSQVILGRDYHRFLVWPFFGATVSPKRFAFLFVSFSFII